MRGAWVILLSLLLALVLMVMPIPNSVPAEVGYARPNWVLMVIFYWVIALPQRVGVIVGWCSGITLDVLLGTLLGLHGFCVMLTAWFAAAAYQRMRMYSVWQQSVVILLTTLVFQLVLMTLSGLLTGSEWHLLQFLPAATSALFWPWVFLLLRMARRRFGVNKIKRLVLASQSPFLVPISEHNSTATHQL